MNHLDLDICGIVPTIGSSINLITCSHQVWLGVMCIMIFSDPSKLLRINFTVGQVISLSALAGLGKLVMILIHSCNALSQQQEMMSSQCPHSSTTTGKERLVQIFQWRRVGFCLVMPSTNLAAYTYTSTFTEEAAHTSHTPHHSNNPWRPNQIGPATSRSKLMCPRVMIMQLESG